MNDFMKDRYGADELTTVLGGLGILITLIGTIFNLGWLMWIGLIIVVVALLRALSKDAEARRRENRMFLDLVAKVPVIGERFGNGASTARRAPSADDLKRQMRTTKKMWKDRKTKAFLKCPTCGTTLAVPKGKGKMIVTCPKCRTRMETRS